jgi:hypothetical protein
VPHLLTWKSELKLLVSLVCVVLFLLYLLLKTVWVLPSASEHRQVSSLGEASVSSTQILTSPVFPVLLTIVAPLKSSHP